MKSFSNSVAWLTASLSLLQNSLAAELSSIGGSCSVNYQGIDDSYFSVVGVQGAGIQPRMEIRDLEKNKEMFNLFTLAMARFQATSQDNKLSYFQIAGIHGAPFVPWDGVNGTGSYGYCPHNSNMFGTWHRPYLALFEQILHQHATELVKEFPEGETKIRYQEAADKLRLPFWDWAIDPPDSDGCMPTSLRNATAHVTLPNGTSAEIPNPLYQYAFHGLNASFFPLDGYEFGVWQNTIRAPLDGRAANASSRNEEVNTRISNQQTNNRDMLYKLLTVHQPFDEWSNRGSGGKVGNIETLHDGIHNSFGVGHMGIIEVSAMDPVFWLHHCNIDRYIAIYQARYPDTWVGPASQAGRTYVYPENVTLDGSSPLAPFHMNANGDMWTSDTVANISSFGYTYPELVDSPSNDTLTATINKLYQPQTQGLNTNNTLTTLGPNNRTGMPQTPKWDNNTQLLNNTADAIDWVAEVNMPSNLKQTYAVRVFLGNFSNDPQNWPTEPSYVGQVASLSGPKMESNVTVTANVVLTDRLAKMAKAGELRSLDVNTVIAFLKNNFHWRVQLTDNTEICRNQTPAGLNVTVASIPVHLPTTEFEVPRWTGNWTYHYDIAGL